MGRGICPIGEPEDENNRASHLFPEPIALLAKRPGDSFHLGERRLHPIKTHSEGGVLQVVPVDLLGGRLQEQLVLLIIRDPIVLRAISRSGKARGDGNDVSGWPTTRRRQRTAFFRRIRRVDRTKRAERRGRARSATGASQLQLRTFRT